jgi:hypothetical protein
MNGKRAARAAMVAMGVMIAAAACSSSSSGPAAQGGDAGTDDGGASDGTTQADVTSGADGGPATITGTVNGKSFVPVDAYIYDESYDFPGAVVRAVKMTSYANGCTVQKADDAHVANSTYLKLYFGKKNSTTMPTVTPGTYAIGMSMPDANGDVVIGGAQLKSFDGTCLPTVSTATAGTLTLTTYTMSGATGSFDLTFGSDRLTGSFGASACDITPPAGAGACQM